MQFFEYYLHQELRQLDIKVDKASQRSFLLNPFRIFIETFEDARRMHPKLAGEYRKISVIINKRPVWKHVDDDYILLSYSGQRWEIKNHGKIWARSELTDKNMLVGSEKWEYYDNNRWIVSFGDVFINLFPVHNVDDELSNICSKVFF